MFGFKNYLNATRVWTLNFVLAANIISISLLYKNQVDINLKVLGCAIVIEILVNNISNLVNSYYDYVNGFDIESTSGDRTMFGYNLNLNQLWSYTRYTFMSVFLVSLYLVYLLNNSSNNNNNNNSKKIIVVIATILLNSIVAFYYTAPPFQLKYNCLGELGASIGYFFLGSFSYYTQSSGSFDRDLDELFHYAMIFTLGCLSIIYSNNVRDINVDKKANIKTIAIYLGERVSFILYYVIYLIIYLYCLFISIEFKNQLLMLPLLTIYDLNQIFKSSKLFQFNIDIDKSSALMVLKISFILSFGIIFGQLLKN